MWLNLVIYLSLSAGVCEAVNIQYEAGMLDQFMKQSDKQCKDSCNKDIKCVWSKYYFRLQLCVIYGTNASAFNAEPDTYVYKKPEIVREHDTLLELDCEANETIGVVSDTCQAKHCGPPAAHLDAEIRGNMYGIGAKVRYNCIDGSNHTLSTCEASGKWTTVHLSCNCSSPTNDDGLAYTLTRYNTTHVIGELSCSDGNKLWQNSQPFCQISSGYWTHVDSRCLKNGWLNIYEYKAGGIDAILGSWRKHKNSGHVYRDTLVDSWQELNISRVKLEVVRNNTVVASMQFNSTGSTKITWFLRNTLINSTWSDLNDVLTPVSYFNITGNDSPRQRFFVSKGANGSSCSNEAWFVVTWNKDYATNCIPGMPISTGAFNFTVIMYAKGTTVSKLNNMEFADAFNVSIYMEFN